MKVIIAGSRTITSKSDVNRSIIEGLNSLLTFNQIQCGDFEIISGGASGVDSIAEYFAKSFNYAFKKFPANWNKYGKKAGYLRNVEMADYADALIAIWDGKSKGTKHMIDIAKKKGLKTYIYKVENESNNK